MYGGLMVDAKKAEELSYASYSQKFIQAPGRKTSRRTEFNSCRPGFFSIVRIQIHLGRETPGKKFGLGQQDHSQPGERIGREVQSRPG